MNGDAYIKAYAVSMLAGGTCTPEEAFAQAKQKWLARVEAERRIDDLIAEDKANVDHV